MSRKREQVVDQDVNVLALVKGEERYVFLYSDEYQSQTLQTIARFASDPHLSFSWYDAAVLSQKLRREKQRQNITILRRSKAKASSEQEG
ncbi:MAG: hypothetical protein PHQ75_04885 [Thermoguttaceae bacterium]|nr:hypothetical protein [Thermoguttaceae bacterium]